MPTAKISALLAVAFLLFACGGRSSGRRADPVTEPRNGNELVPVDLAYYDARPSMDAAGKKIVFISGRAQSRQAFKLDMAVADAGPSRLLPESSAVGAERRASLSTAGSWVVLETAKDGQIDLQFVDFAGSKAVTAVTSDAATEFDCNFADDSVFAFVKSDNNARYGKINVAAIAANGTLTAPVALTSPSNFVEYNPTWSVSGPNYTLFTLGRDTTSQKIAVISRTFSGVSTAAAATATTLVSGLDIKYGTFMPMAAASQAGLYFAAKPSTKKEVVPSGGNKTTEKKLIVLNEPQLIAAAGTPSTLPSLGFDIRGVSANAAGTMAAWLGGELFSCEPNDQFGYIVHLYDKATNAMSRLLPRTGNEAGSWQLSRESCTTKRADGSDGALDYRLEALQLAAASTTSDYSLVYVSTASGDHEVIHLRVVADQATFTSVSRNRKP